MILRFEEADEKVFAEALHRRLVPEAQLVVVVDILLALERQLTVGSLPLLGDSSLRRSEGPLAGLVTASLTLHATEPPSLYRARAQRPGQLCLRFSRHLVRPLMLIRVVRGRVGSLWTRQRLDVRAMEAALLVITSRLILLHALVRLAERILVLLESVGSVAYCLLL